MRQFNYWQAIYQSFYSKALYRDVANHWGAGVFLYLLLVLAISWSIIMAVQVQPTITRESLLTLKQFAPQFPIMTIDKGIVTTPSNKPYLIKNPDTQKIVAIIDTSGQYKTLDSQAHYALLTDKQFFWKQGDGIVKVYNIPNDFTAELNPTDLRTTLEKWVPWLWVILFPLFLLFSFCYRIVQSLLYAIIGEVLVLLTGIKLSYSKIVKLTMVSITPAIVIGTALDWIDLNFHREWLFYFVLSMGYLFYAIWANKEEKF